MWRSCSKAPRDWQRSSKLTKLSIGLYNADLLSPIPGVSDRIAQLRRRHQQLSANIEHYEARVAQQGRELQMMNRPSSGGGYEEDEEMAEPEIDVEEDPDSLAIPITKEDVEHEEDEIKELERKKKALEERVTGMERDLGGLMR